MRLFISLPTFVLSCVQLVLGAPTPAQLTQRAAAHSSELVSFPASKAYLANSASVVKSFANTVLSGKSGATLYYGIGIEDTSVGWLFLDGFSISTTDSATKTALTPLLASSSSAITTQHINFPATTLLPAIFTSGDTELTRVTLKSGSTLAQVTPLLDKLDAAIASASGGVGAVYGTNTVEHAGTLELVAGWASSAAHTAATSTTALTNIITPLLVLVDIVPVNVVFHKF